MARFNLRLPDDVDARISGYASEHDITKTAAIVALLDIGLAVANEGPYVSQLAQITRDTMRAELGVFMRRIEDWADDRQDAIDRKLDAAAAAAHGALLATTAGQGSDIATLQLAGSYMTFGLDADDSLDAARRQTPSIHDDVSSMLWED